MINKYFKILNLEADSTLDDAGKAYRKLAKQNHPDRFTDENQKKKQEKIMAGINEAYMNFVSGYKNNVNNFKSEKSKNDFKIEKDYILYKKGIEFYNIYFHSFFQLFSKRVVKTLQEKESILLEAKLCFARLLQEFPDSDWVYDSEEKLRKINKTIEALNKQKESNKKSNLKDSRHY